MKNLTFKKALMGCFALLVGAGSTFAQSGGMPPVSKDQWQISAHIGNASLIPGEMDMNYNLGYGLSVRKSLGYVVSVRGGLWYSRMSGWNTTPMRQYNPRNFDLRLWEATLTGVISLNNLSFIKKASRWNVYAEFGISLNGYNNRADLRDANGNLYDYSKISYYNPDGTEKSRSDVISQFEAQMDGTNETWKTIDGTSGREVINVYLTGGMGVDYMLNKNFSLGLNQRFLFSRDDSYDGYLVPGSVRDVISYTTVSVGYFLGKNKEKPRWYSNPVEKTYDMIANSTKKVDDATKDSDGDGVADAFDKENNTPAGALVNSKGQTLDSDKDGIADHLDAEPFSEPGVKVDSKGVSTESKKPWANRSNNGGDDTGGGSDEGGDTGGGTGGNTGGGTGGKGGRVIGGNGGRVSSMILPHITFDNASDFIRTENYVQLYQIARLLKDNPSVKLDVIGYADAVGNENVNNEISRYRAEAVVKALTEKFGVDKSRLTTKFEGEKNLIMSYDNKHPERKVNAVNRRVEFKIQ